jgi:SAM-dependent methyltransferase
VSDCPLCLNPNTEKYSEDKIRSYYQCSNCQLVFVPRSDLISFQKEKERYDAHENDASDSGYFNYLTTISEQIDPFLGESKTGLDFGCGRTTILADQFLGRGYEMESYDAYFLKNELIWDKNFDFIILSEVIEHLRGPRQDMRQLVRLLNPGGKLFIKTKLLPETKASFDQWFYKRDSTHVQFFNHASMEFLKNYLGMKNVKTIGPDLYFID